MSNQFIYLFLYYITNYLLIASLHGVSLGCFLYNVLIVRYNARYLKDVYLVLNHIISDIIFSVIKKVSKVVNILIIRVYRVIKKKNIAGLHSSLLAKLLS